MGAVDDLRAVDRCLVPFVSCSRCSGTMHAGRRAVMSCTGPRPALRMELSTVAACPLRGPDRSLLNVLSGQLEVESVLQSVEVQLELAGEFGVVQFGTAYGLVEEVELTASEVGG